MEKNNRVNTDEIQAINSYTKTNKWQCKFGVLLEAPREREKAFQAGDFVVIYIVIYICKRQQIYFSIRFSEVIP